MNKKRWLGYVLIVGVPIGTIFLYAWKGALYPATVTSLSDRALFGESFGVVNAIVSALAFMGLLVTIAMQQRQLSEQAQELRRQADRDQENRERDELDQYEQQLFRLLGFYLESVDAVRIMRNGREHIGRAAFAHGLESMQRELKTRKLHFVPETVLGPVKAGKGSAPQILLVDYVAMETCRVVQYTLGYQRRVIASLLTLLRHMECRCPSHADINTYRSVISAQITHIEVQYLFAMMLIYENERELRDLLDQSGLFRRDSPPYNFKLHQYLYKRLWGKEVGDSTQARRLPFNGRKSARLRHRAQRAPLSLLLKQYGISGPVRPESLGLRTPQEAEPPMQRTG